MLNLEDKNIYINRETKVIVLFFQFLLKPKICTIIYWFFFNLNYTVKKLQ